jgi:hypothetical protein
LCGSIYRNLKERDYLGKFGVDEKNAIKIYLKETERGRVNYIHMTLDTVRSAARIHEQDKVLINSLKQNFLAN